MKHSLIFFALLAYGCGDSYVPEAEIKLRASCDQYCEICQDASEACNSECVSNFIDLRSAPFFCPGWYYDAVDFCVSMVCEADLCASVESILASTAERCGA